MLTPSLDNTLCAQPWVGLQIRPNKGLRPCCMYPDDITVYQSPESLGLYHKSEKLRAIRREMLRGELPKECSGCKKEEELTGSSPRIFSPGFSQSIDTHEQVLSLNKVEIFVSNLCNLDCVMCSPTFSSKWNHLLPELNEKKMNFNNFQKVPVERVGAGVIDSVYEHARDAKEVILLGGEPFASKEALSFIERWIQDGRTGQLTIISNATLLNADIIETLSRCKNLFLILSIDAVGPLYEWIRGHDWSTVEAHLLEARKKIDHLMLSPTIAAYNVFGMDALSKFCVEHEFRFKTDHMLSEPAFLSLEILPFEMRQGLTKQLLSIENTSLNRLVSALQMDFPTPSLETKQKFIQWVEFFNKKRNINLFHMYPQLELNQ